MVFKTGCPYRNTLQLSTKKALDLVGEKMSGQLLPDPALMDKLLDDEAIQDPQGLMERQYVTGTSVTLAEDIVWPVPKECFQLNVIL